MTQTGEEKMHKMKIKTYGGYAPTKSGKMVRVVTTDAQSEEDAAKALSRFAWGTGIDEMEIREEKP